MSKLQIIREKLENLKELENQLDIDVKNILTELLDFVTQLEQQCISLLQERNEDTQVQPTVSWNSLRTDRLPLKINLMTDRSEI
tara:strand:+ start:1302 stop:1553 length:252 start_codon:yes stop_codon:yes gene_type:complete